MVYFSSIYDVFLQMKIGFIGAVNVGKSTLFNRMLGQFRAIVTDVPGTTRDILEEQAQLSGLGNVILMDSPGLLDYREELQMIEKIIKEADVLVFVIDSLVGIGPKEQEIKELILKHHKAQVTVVVVNKISQSQLFREYEQSIADYYGLGFAIVVGTNAQQGHHIELVVDAVKAVAPQNTAKVPDVVTDVHIAIVGKPNAGKSTLLNTFAGKVLSKVEDVAGTTLDYVVHTKKLGPKTIKIYDTMGLRKKSRRVGLERIGYEKMLSLIRFVNPVCVLLLDGSEGVVHQDFSVLTELAKLNVPVIIAINKVDLMDQKQLSRIMVGLKEEKHFEYTYPVIAISAEKGNGLQQLMKLIIQVSDEFHKRITTGELNKAISQAFLLNPPRFPKNKVCKIYYATQHASNPPTFVFQVNHKDHVTSSFKRRLENNLRKSFGMQGVPFVFQFRDGKPQ